MDRPLPELVLGLIDPAISFLGTRAADQNLSCLDEFLCDNPGVAYRSAGLGSVLIWKPLAWLQSNAGIRDAIGGSTDNPYDGSPGRPSPWNRPRHEGPRR